MYCAERTSNGLCAFRIIQSPYFHRKFSIIEYIFGYTDLIGPYRKIKHISTFFLRTWKNGQVSTESEIEMSVSNRFLYIGSKN